MARILAITDSLSEQAGGLSHATLNLAASTACVWPNSKFYVLSQKDNSEIHSSSLVNPPPNLEVITAPCFRNRIFPWSSGLLDKIISL